MSKYVKSVLGMKERSTEDRAITAKMDRERKGIRGTVEILMLGAGGSGKSTVVKHMLEQNDVTVESALDLRRDECVSTLCHDIHIICQSNTADREENPEYFCIGDAKLSALIDRIGVDKSFLSDMELTPALATQIALIWGETGIKRSYVKRCKSWIMDNTIYFLDRVVDLADPSWHPSFDQFILARNQTTGIITHEFKAPTEHSDKVWTFKITDVGGQHSERRKWIKVFTEVDVVLFVFSLAAYDCLCWEDHRLHAYDDAFSAFADSCHNPSFEMTDFVVFLNKDDLFVSKLTEDNISFHGAYTTDPAFEGEAGLDPKTVRDYVMGRFTELFSEPPSARSSSVVTDASGTGMPRRTINFYTTCATDVEFMKELMPRIQARMVQRLLHHAALI